MSTGTTELRLGKLSGPRVHLGTPASSALTWPAPPAPWPPPPAPSPAPSSGSPSGCPCCQRGSCRRRPAPARKGERGPAERGRWRGQRGNLPPSIRRHGIPGCSGCRCLVMLKGMEINPSRGGKSATGAHHRHLRLASPSLRHARRTHILSALAEQRAGGQGPPLLDTGPAEHTTPADGCGGHTAQAQTSTCMHPILTSVPDTAERRPAEGW